MSDEDYDKEYEILIEMFPNATFTIAIDLKEINNILSHKTSIIIQHSFSCYCYDNSTRVDKYTITNVTGPITIKYAIEQLIKQGLSPECNHRFLEAFDKMDDENFSMFFGS